MDRVRINILSEFLTKGTQLSPGKEGRLNERDKKEMAQETGGGRRGERERRVYKSVASQVKVTAQAKGHRHGDR